VEFAHREVGNEDTRFGADAVLQALMTLRILGALIRENRGDLPDSSFFRTRVTAGQTRYV
jgi:hypothetical protein